MTPFLWACLVIVLTGLSCLAYPPGEPEVIARRWQQTKHLAGWLFIIACCLATLALFGLAVAQALAQPHATVPR